MQVHLCPGEVPENVYFKIFHVTLHCFRKYYKGTFYEDILRNIKPLSHNLTKRSNTLKQFVIWHAFSRIYAYLIVREKRISMIRMLG